MIRFCTRESILGPYFINIYIIFFITRKRHKYFNNEDGTKFPEWIIWFLSPLQTSFYTQMTCHLYFIRERYIYIYRERWALVNVEIGIFKETFQICLGSSQAYSWFNVETLLTKYQPLIFPNYFTVLLTEKDQTH